MNLSRWLTLAAAPVLLPLLGGCFGASDVNGVTTTPPTVENPLPDPAHEDTGPAFELPRDQLALLPFRVRLAKVAAVLGVPTSDPALAELRNNHLDLGDFDFASGVRADRAWSPVRMTLWVRSLRPVCNAPQMKARYPALPADFGKLVLAAHGRPLDPSDSALLEEAMNGVALDDAGRYLAVCLAVLSSAEFVSR